MSLGVVNVVVAWATGLTDGTPVRAVGLAMLAGAAAWVRWTGRISRVSVHPLTIAMLLGTFALDLSVKDDLLRVLAAAWILLISVMMSSALSRRAVAW